MLRHDLAWVRPGSPFRPLEGTAGEAGSAAVLLWLEAGHPLVVCRQSPGAKDIRLALTQPLRLGRQRIACRFDRDAVCRTRPPLEVGACLDCLDPDARQALSILDKAIRRSGARLGIFGSLAWEALTGEAYRHADSDIDIICDIASQDQLATCLAALEDAARRLPCRLDGEVRFPGGVAVAWRELASRLDCGKAQVLVKGDCDVRLLPIATLLAHLPEAAACG